VTIVPARGGLYVNAMPTGASRVASIELADEFMLTLDQFEAGAAERIHPSNPLDIASEQGIRLIGYDLQGDVLTTYWRVDAINAETQFAPFIHVLDENGVRVQIVDGAVVPGSLWAVGDVHIHMLTITDAEQYALQVGQYDSMRGQNVIFLPDYVPTICIAGCE
jgi:hypothetical protein